MSNVEFPKLYATGIKFLNFDEEEFEEEKDG